jgi:hypothetical protein
MNDRLRVTIGGESFEARLRDDLAPRTCERFRALLPFSERLIHVRWSGEACWIPLGRLDHGIGYENATSEPNPGDMIFYPGSVSETEILLAYGRVRFACNAGQLAGNPFLTMTGELDRLAEMGRRTLWQGAQEIRFG